MCVCVCVTKTLKGGLLISPSSSGSGPNWPELAEVLLWVIIATLITMAMAAPLRGQHSTACSNTEAFTRCQCHPLGLPRIEKKSKSIVFLYKLLRMWKLLQQQRTDNQHILQPCCSPASTQQAGDAGRALTPLSCTILRPKGGVETDDLSADGALRMDLMDTVIDWKASC